MAFERIEQPVTWFNNTIEGLGKESLVTFEKRLGREDLNSEDALFLLDFNHVVVFIPLKIGDIKSN